MKTSPPLFSFALAFVLVNLITPTLKPDLKPELESELKTELQLDPTEQNLNRLDRQTKPNSLDFSESLNSANSADRGETEWDITIGLASAEAKSRGGRSGGGSFGGSRSSGSRSSGSSSSGSRSSGSSSSGSSGTRSTYTRPSTTTTTTRPTAQPRTTTRPTTSPQTSPQTAPQTGGNTGGVTQGGSFNRRPTTSPTTSPTRSPYASPTARPTTTAKPTTTTAPSRTTKIDIDLEIETDDDSPQQRGYAPQPVYVAPQPVYVVPPSDDDAEPPDEAAETSQEASGGSSFVKLLLFLLLTAAIVGMVWWLLSRTKAGSTATSGMSASDRELSNDVVTVSQLKVVLLASAKSIQAQLTKLSETADLETNEGLAEFLKDCALALLRKPEYWVYVQSSSDTVADRHQAQVLFERCSVEERSKFSSEAFVRKGDRITIAEDANEAGDPNELPEYIVVTLLVGSEHDTPLFNKVYSVEDLKTSLETLASLPPDYVSVFTLLWTPQAETDSLSQEELLTLYPNLIALG